MIYIDESARDNELYFFGALIADASAIRTITDGIDGIARLMAGNVAGFNAEAEFHAVDIFHGRKEWKKVPHGWRVKACDLAAKVLARSTAKYVFQGINLAALRSKYAHPFPAHQLTLAHILEEVDRQITTLDRPDKLGIVHADEHHTADNARRSFRNFRLSRVPGYTTRRLGQIADTIYFGPSHESRLLQAADLATYFLNRDLTITERDPRAEIAIKKIVGNIRSVTVKEYVWSPI